jgi:drug/metabolite transporter (DMT)-like permease
VLGQAVTLVSTRRLRVLSVFVIQWYYALASCLITGGSVAFLQEKKFSLAFTESNFTDWAFILTISILNNIGQNLSTWINQRANPATLGIFGYFSIGFTFILDILIFNITFSGLEVTGVCICLLFSLMAAIYKHFCMPPKNSD